jgi:shikimate dehydrogenase
MARFAVIGDPVSHSLSPVMHRAGYAARGLEHTYEAIRVEAGTVAKELDRLQEQGFAGVNVTVPLKEEAMEWAHPDDFALRVRAVNTIDLSTRLGINTDGPGFVVTLDRLLGPTETQLETVGPERRVLLLGAGGSARAIAFALAEASYPLAIWNRTHARAVELAHGCGAVALETPNLDNFDIVVNATSASMRGELPSPVLRDPGETGPEGRLAVDLFYGEAPTAFVKHFAEIGWKAVDGKELLVAQGALSFEFWLGGPAPLEAMRQAVGL